MYAGTWAAQWSTVSGKGTARAVRRAAGDALVFFSPSADVWSFVSERLDSAERIVVSVRRFIFILRDVPHFKSRTRQ
jgi:hypothetical protein